ncbi:hypothetical protein BFJ65_g18633 [Fusarium oxysporum f. sp. cepae]|uniref:HTH CENPB-type domain-containing protein n=1 Tax=Fusarium oxysporum f. sp. cepae TaxID=396571 RepID=A0A3L6MQJ4_FUSOX|nr:hypothetical protein BFJ65_g18633 [Fusarium oxysporum f. sp. cepae]
MVRRNYTEDDVAEAILDTTDRGLSQNEAAQKRGVPQSTLSGRLSGQASRNERIQAHQRIPKSQEETLIRWVLRQESLGYAPSHSQLRACVEAILKQQGDNKPLGKHWTTRFVKRHLELSTKLGKRQEAARFDGFTPKAVNWYFDIRENEYGWIKPENTVNVDEGGIMVGFGLDSLVIGSSDPKKKAMLKGVQSRTWTSFIEAVTATGRALKPGIIFKGKELQKQWFLNEFELIADWHYITSPNGWTDNHIALEWLKDVYLPQTEPRDASDARLIILDGHGSHAQDEWMATCFLNNVYCCYLPAHCSHGLQPLDNGIFNVIKGAYRKELQKLASLTDSAPVDKVHFIRAYAKAREAGMGKDIILSGWRFTGNWPINRHKALTHPEIQPDKEKVPERFKTPSPPQLHSDDTPKTSRQVRDLAKHRSRPTRRKYSKIAKGLEALEMKVAVQNARITGLEEQMAQVRRGKKRKAVPNPNRRFMALAETLTAGEALPDSKKAEIEVDVDEKDESVIEELYEAEETRDPLMLHSIDMGWFVLDKYYALSGESPIYATALLLDPSKRARYLKVHWKEEWAATAIRDGRTIWEEEYKMAPALGPAQALSEASRSQQGQPNELDRLLNEIMVAEDITRDVDDFENFIHAQPIKIEGSPLVWWCQRDQVRTYPRLSRMAIDILSVPPGSADPESAFSGGRRTLSWDRERMSCVNLEKVECIGNWLREGLIIPSSRGGRGLVVDGEINGSIWVDSDDYLD